MQKEKQLVPKLRFSEFVGEWESKKIEKGFSIFNRYASFCQELNIETPF